MRARMALHVSECDFEHREVLLRDKPEAMLALSPKATVPVLAVNDDHIIDESFDIMMWALAQHDPQNWLQPGLDNMRPLIEMITGNFKHHLDRYKYASRYGDAARPAVDHTHRALACDILQDFETRLAASPYLMGERASLADYATFPFIRQFANVEQEWWNTPVLPHVHNWLDGFIRSDIFTHIMTKHPVWKPEP
ncbi:MAG TPA: glutathione S-transferase [Hellea balneolensis]|uniref:Glutathione S-transferase n=1 Tax=Hellea balneolensis TaxID=287478 RepID=A0A7C3FZY9_9PROT|nr:glutathione S-transferase [Hellea balneolensis]